MNRRKRIYHILITEGAANDPAEFSELISLAKSNLGNNLREHHIEEDEDHRKLFISISASSLEKNNILIAFKNLKSNLRVSTIPRSNKNSQFARIVHFQKQGESEKIVGLKTVKIKGKSVSYKHRSKSALVRRIIKSKFPGDGDTGPGRK